MTKLDVGRLTEEETVELSQELLRALTEEKLFEVLESALTTEQKEELGETWFNIDR